MPSTQGLLPGFEETAHSDSGKGPSGSGDEMPDYAGKRNATLEDFVNIEHESRYVIVVLGRKQEVMQRVANQLQHLAGNGHLAEAIQGYKAPTKVLVAADIVHALQLWQGHGYHQVSTIFVHPDEESGEPLLSIHNFKDHYGVTAINRERVLTEAGAVDEAAVAKQLTTSLEHHLSVIGQVRKSHGSTEDVQPSGLLTPEGVKKYDRELEQIISARAPPAIRDAWADRRAEEVINTKRVQRAPQAQRQMPSSVPTADEALKAVNAITQARFVPIREADYGRTTGPDDSRRASPELGRHLETILACAAQSQPAGMTHLTHHATRGIIGLFAPGMPASDPETNFRFVKPYKSEAEVEALFRDYKRLRDRGLVVLHEPLAYHRLGETGEFAVVSSSALLAISAKVAEQTRLLGAQLKQPSIEEGYLDALMKVDLEFLIRYKRIAEMPITEADMVLALHKYTATERTSVQDLQLATGTSLSELEERAFLSSLGIFDDLSLWNPQLFGPIMDNKTYNNGHRMGTIEPTPELVKAVLFEGALRSDGSLDGAAGQSALERNMKRTFSILEYAARMGVVWEDYFHTENSPDLNIPPQKKPGHLLSFMHMLMPDATEQDSKGIWPAYFAMEFFKTLRKMQRTVHYAITTARTEEDSIERASIHKTYMKEYQAYRAWLMQTAFAATTMLTDHVGDSFAKQLTVLGQLYAERSPHFPNHPETLPQIPRALCGAYLALQRLIEEPPKPRLLRSLDIVR